MIRTLWFSLNRNLNRNPVFIPADSQLSDYQCENSIFDVNKLYSLRLCRILSLSETFNFTPSLTYTRDSVYNFYIYIILNPLTVDYVVNRGVLEANLIEYNIVKFGFVTPFPTALNGLDAFLSPFDELMWSVLLVLCVMVSLIVTFSRRLGNYTVIQSTLNIIEDFLNIATILFGQVNAESVKTYYKNVASVPLLTAWFLCGGYIIMDNLYMGSIFSYLSAIKPPILPSNLKELLESDIPIVTCSFYKKDGIPEDSILKNVIIPTYQNSIGKESEFMKLLDNLVKRVMFINSCITYPELSKLVKSIEKSESIMNSSLYGTHLRSHGYQGFC